jgi:hypothetical protein
MTEPRPSLRSGLKTKRRSLRVCPCASPGPMRSLRQASSCCPHLGGIRAAKNGARWEAPIGPWMPSRPARADRVSIRPYILFCSSNLLFDIVNLDSLSPLIRRADAELVSELSQPMRPGRRVHVPLCRIHRQAVHRAEDERALGGGTLHGARIKAASSPEPAP